MSGLGSILTWALVAVLANPGAELEQLRRSGGASPVRVEQLVEAALAAPLSEETASDAARCAAGFRRAEWLRAAAQLVPDAGYDERALGRYRALRVEFPREAASWLGYIGEARVQRDAGRLAEAYAVLDAVRDKKSGAGDALRTLARAEWVEVKLREDPAGALEPARALGGRGRWLLARALAATGDAAGAVAAARGAEGVSEFDRLAFIADHGQPSDAERTRWAALLVQAGRESDALRLLEERAPVATRSIRARLLDGADRAGEAAVIWDEVVRDDPQDLDAVWAAARAWDTAATADPQAAPRARAALRRAADRGLDDDRRAGALRRWVSYAPAAEVAALALTHADLVEADPWLTYAVAAAQVSSGERGDGPVKALERVVDDERASPALRRAAVLLRADLLRAEPRAALALLEAHGVLLSSDPATARAVAGRQVVWWTALGLLDPAVDAVLDDPEAQEPGALMALAVALTERYAETPTAKTRAQVVRLVALAVGRAPDDLTLSTAAGNTLLAVEALGGSRAAARGHRRSRGAAGGGAGAGGGGARRRRPGGTRRFDRSGGGRAAGFAGAARRRDRGRNRGGAAGAGGGGRGRLGVVGGHLHAGAGGGRRGTAGGRGGAASGGGRAVSREPARGSAAACGR